MAGPAWADDHKLSGDLTLAGPGFGLSTRACHGGDLGGGYDDIDRGAQVKIKNADGKVIGVTALGAGKRTEASSVNTDCLFRFSVKVPDSDFYSVEISHRGELTYPEKKLEKAKWRVHVTLGA
jgi:hypothetical protein